MRRIADNTTMLNALRLSGVIDSLEVCNREALTERRLRAHTHPLPAADLHELIAARYERRPQTALPNRAKNRQNPPTEMPGATPCAAALKPDHG